MSGQVRKGHPYGQPPVDLLCGHSPNVGSKRPNRVVRGTWDTSTDRREILTGGFGRRLSWDRMECIICSGPDLRRIALLSSSQPLSLVFISPTPCATDRDHVFAV